VRLIVAALAAIVSACDAPRESAPDPSHQPSDAAAPTIVTLAPHLTELVYTAGSGEHLVGVSAYSDFPPAATALPIVSDAFTVDQERLTLLEPDLLLAWESGTPQHVVDELRDAGHRVEVVRTRGLADVATAIEQIGALTARREISTAAANEFRAAIARLRADYSGEASIRVFYQVSLQPLYTINGDHYIGEILALCGGDNVFAELNELAPAITAESVIERDPEVLLAGATTGDAAFGPWERWPQLAAIRYGNRYTVDADQVGRPTTRLAMAARAICAHLETSRANRAAAATS
jgi:iron complex transport system substrate-binding protein